MILRTLYISIREPNSPVEYKYAFKRASRFFCNYIEREVLKRLRFRAQGFDQVSVGLASSPADEIPINTFHVACVRIGFPKEEIDRASGEELTKLQIALLRDGIRKCASSHAIPEAEMLQGLDRFEENGMRNEWLHKQKTFRSEGFVASLSCKMTQDRFTLHIAVIRGQTPIFDAIILDTPPDELLFETKFKDVVIDGERLVVVGSRESQLWSKPLSELSA